MKATVLLAAAALAVGLFMGSAKASGPIAVYALIDKVTLEQNADQPERIRIAGVFLTAGYQSNEYSGPKRGYLYFTLPDQSTEQVRREWADLKSVAGTQQVVAFGSSWFGTARVRSADEEPKSPDRFVLGNGLSKVNADHPRAKELLDFKDR